MRSVAVRWNDWAGPQNRADSSNARAALFVEICRTAASWSGRFESSQRPWAVTLGTVSIPPTRGDISWLVICASVKFASAELAR